MNKTIRTVLIAVLAVVLVGGGIFVGIHWNDWFGKDDPAKAQVDSNAEDYTGDKGTYTGEKNEGTIDIPGFDTMTFQAGTKEQSVNFYNPEANTCYFKIFILLPDGTQIFESDLLAPGKAFYNISINQALDAGSYENAVLKYECFKMDEAQTPLNGAETVFTLQVLE